ncbi:hypothetical protein E2562_016031 [Oryza meyeriana var. granulata]|uniref:Uncharacterized protein n=1 Tax=Oryza meyeriana var. granulata TaxID=110450 RepID=A0A6G1EKS0_9ORYZ|nr:hypothetical protein E2562_016031 [Oryza meyeriana var. granulata]
MACCRIVLVLFFCVCILVATTDAVKGASAATSAAAGGGRWTELTAGSPARYSAGGLAGADVFRDSKRRIPKGPDPIHNSLPEPTKACREDDDCASAERLAGEEALLPVRVWMRLKELYDVHQPAPAMHKMGSLALCKDVASFSFTEEDFGSGACSVGSEWPT